MCLQPIASVKGANGGLEATLINWSYSVSYFVDYLFERVLLCHWHGIRFWLWDCRAVGVLILSSYFLRLFEQLKTLFILLGTVPHAVKSRISFRLAFGTSFWNIIPSGHKAGHSLKFFVLNDNRATHQSLYLLFDPSRFQSWPLRLSI